ncbi:MAG TPA: OB-fold nucleic acid binding domain-containing protein, partial [Acidimicrobiales bacterium]|nr:OB-fold nucleic acid binding domain-containing protein [Acidimicrobiales bacterium]
MARSLGQLAATPVSVLEGVGTRHAIGLTAMGIDSVFDLLTHYPRRYLDRTKQVRIADVRIGEEAVVLAKVARISGRRTRGGKALVEADIGDGSGFLRLSFFNQMWRLQQLPEGTEAVFVGKVDTYQGRRRMTPQYVDLIGDQTGRIVSVYPQSE